MNTKIQVLLIVFLFTYKFCFLLINSNKDKISFYDVGEGDAALIQTRTGKRVLIDGGPDFEVSRYLNNEFIFTNCSLDIVVITHFHADHIFGINRILDNCSVKKIIYTYSKPESKEAKTLISKINKEKSVEVFSGNTIKIDNLTLHFIWPSKSNLSLKKEGESNVLAFFAELNNFKVLFLSDLNSEYSKSLDSNELLKILDSSLSIYKVPHHGSVNAHNINLITALNPKVCVISVGEKNKYNHPSVQVVSDLVKNKCIVKRTDLVGTIEVFAN